MPQIPGGEDLVHPALAAYGLGRPIGPAVEATDGSWPVVYMQIGSRGMASLVTDIGIFPKLTSPREWAIVNDDIFYDVRAFLGACMSTAVSTTGREHTSIDLLELRHRLQTEKDPGLSPKGDIYARHIRHILAAVQGGAKVILDHGVKSLSPDQQLFEGELPSPTLWLPITYVRPEQL